MSQVELIIDIDTEVELLLQQINSAPNSEQKTEFIESFQNMLIDQVLGPFGLSRSMFQDRDGGAITTVHNFEKGVVANDADAERHSNWRKANENNFERERYDDKLNERFPMADMKSEDGKYHDGYREPGSELPVGPRIAARDHVIPASEIERSSRGHLAQTHDERVETATQKENIVLTDYGMNSSKSDKDLMEWASLPNSQDPGRTNREYYGLDESILREKHQKAKDAVETAQKKAVLIKQGKEFLVEGGKAAGSLALRQIVALLLKDVVSGLVEDVRYFVRVGLDGARSLADVAMARLEATFQTIRGKWSEYLKEGISAGLSGFMSTLATVVINSFITTAKNIVSLIREAVLALVRAIKVIVSPEQGMSKEDIAAEVFRLLSAAVVTCMGLALEETIKKALESVPLLAPIAGELASVITGVLTGTLTLFTLLVFDRIKGAIAFHNKQMADVHRGHTISYLRIKQTVLMLDAAYQNVTLTADALKLQFSKSLVEIQDSHQRTQKSISSYRNSVQALDDLLEKF